MRHKVNCPSHSWELIKKNAGNGCTGMMTRSEREMRDGVRPPHTTIISLEPTNYPEALPGGRAIHSKGNYSRETGSTGNIIGLSGGCTRHSGTNWNPKT